MISYIAPIFGTGKDGTKVSSSNEDVNTLRQSCSISQNSNQLTVTDIAPWTVGDLVFIHKSQGNTNAGEARFARVVSKSGAILTLDRNINIAFADSGSDQSQAILVKEYRSWKINSGVTVAPSAWDGNVGGITVVLVQNLFDCVGTLAANSCGYRGGAQNGANQNGNQGESYLGVGSAVTSRNGTGGGGGDGGGNTGTGPGNSAAGGAYASNASNGPIHFEFSQDGGPASEGGLLFGDANLNVMIFGGAGGGGGRDSGSVSPVGVGGKSGGIIIVFAYEIRIDPSTGFISCNGESTVRHPNNHNGTGGGGSGGSFALRCVKGSGFNRTQVEGGVGEWGCAQQHSNKATDGTRGRGRIECAEYSGSTPGVSEIVLDKGQFLYGNTLNGL